MASAALFEKLSNFGRIPLLSRLSPSSNKAATAEEIEGFKKAQTLAYACATELSQAIRPGWTERRAAAWMEAYLYDSGVRSYFHKPLAWYGERTRFKGFHKSSQALPQDRPLKAEEVVVVDLAPIVDSYVADIGFGFSLQQNELLSKGREFLLEMRKELPKLFASPLSPAEIWDKIDAQVKEAGYENCHRKYLFHVLGHRVHRVPLSHMPSTGGVYSLHGYWALVSRGLFPELLSPWHHGEKVGLWALEPHIGVQKQFGLKFEEVLVVEKDRAYWLDENVPHLKLPKGVY